MKLTRTQRVSQDDIEGVSVRVAHGVLRRPPRRRTLSSRSTGTDQITPQADSDVYEWLCEETPLKKTGRSYLSQRGFSGDTIAQFDVHELTDATLVERAARQEWGESRLLACGLFKMRENRGQLKARLVWWDHCLIFRFRTAGRTTYLQARRMADDGKAKYVGLAGVRKPLFNSGVLTDLRAGESLYMCEGVMDAMSAAQLELPAVAVLGASSYRTEFTQELLSFDLHVVPDSDAAGGKLLAKIREEFALHGRSVAVVRLDGAKDLNDYLQSLRKHGRQR